MAYEMKPDSGSLFKNDKREKDSQPNAKGQALIGGVEYWVSAWTNDGPKGKYQQLKFERKDAKPAAPGRPVGRTDADPDSDIPFIVSLLEFDIEAPKARRLGRADF